MCHFCETGKLSIQPLNRLKNSSPVIISCTFSEESAMNCLNFTRQNSYISISEVYSEIGKIIVWQRTLSIINI
jgi:hypothetical protein